LVSFIIITCPTQMSGYVD